MERCKLFLLLAAAALVAASCAPCRRTTMQRSTSLRDSVTIELRPRLVEHTESLYIELPRYSDRALVKGDTSILDNPFAHSEAIITPSGELLHTLSLASQPLATLHTTSIEVRDSVVWRERTINNTIEVERELSWWQRLQIRGFWALLSILSGGVILRRVIG